MSSFSHKIVKSSQQNLNTYWSSFQNNDRRHLFILNTPPEMSIKKGFSPDSDWVRIGEYALNQYNQNEIKHFFEQKLVESGINARVQLKPYSDYYELRVINHKELTYKIELKICELFGILEESFPNNHLELLILTEGD